MISYLPTLRQCAQLAAGAVPDAPPKGRYNRATLCGADGRELQLTIPVTGGINAVKYGDPHSWHCADDKKWRHRHLGAINAAYGRTPFFQHIFPEIEAVITDTSENSVEVLNARLYGAMEEFMQLRRLMPQLATGNVETHRKVAAELFAAIPAPPQGVSALHYIFHLGPEAAICALAPLLNCTKTQ